MWRNKRTSKAWSMWRNMWGDKRTNKAWSNEQTSTALIMAGCFLLVGLAGYSIGYRRGSSRRKSEAITPTPSNVAITETTYVEPEQGREAETLVVMEQGREAETPVEPEQGREAETPVETEQGDGQRARGTPLLSEELGTQQLFSQVVPYIRRTFYVE
jgi:hypothetical protein